MHRILSLEKSSVSLHAPKVPLRDCYDNTLCLGDFCVWTLGWHWVPSWPFNGIHGPAGNFTLTRSLAAKLATPLSRKSRRSHLAASTAMRKITESAFEQNFPRDEAPNPKPFEGTNLGVVASRACFSASRKTVASISPTSTTRNRDPSIVRCALSWIPPIQSARFPLTTISLPKSSCRSSVGSRMPERWVLARSSNKRCAAVSMVLTCRGN